MKKVCSVIRCDRIAPDEIDVPILLCDENWRIIYKNKIAYLYKFPRVGAFVLKNACNLIPEHLSSDSITRICFSWSVEDFKTAYAVGRREKGTVLIFLRAFSLKEHNSADEEFTKFILNLGKRMDFSRKTKESLPLPSSFLQLERKCLSTALRTNRRISGSEMALDRISYVLDEYFKRIFKTPKGISCRVEYGFRCDFPYAGISYIESSEFLIACFLLISSRLAFYGGGSLEVILTQRGKAAVFEGIVAPKNKVEHIIKEFEASAELFIFRRLADAHGWNFEIMELFDMERIAFRLYVETYQHPHVLTSQIGELSPEEALAYFLSFIGD